MKAIVPYHKLKVRGGYIALHPIKEGTPTDRAVVVGKCKTVEAVAVGDEVAFSPCAGVLVPFGDRDLLFVKEHDLVALDEGAGSVSSSRTDV